jgi:hypothetical protein
MGEGVLMLICMALIVVSGALLAAFVAAGNLWHAADAIEKLGE